MVKTKISLTDTLSDHVLGTNVISSAIGDIALLTTIEDSDVVGAINSLKSEVDSNYTSGGVDLSAFSVIDSGGDGSLAYDSSSGVFNFLGPSSSEVRAHFSAGAGISITGGVVAIQDSGVTSTLIADATITGADIASATITSANFSSATSIILYDSSGSTLKTLYGTGS